MFKTFSTTVDRGFYQLDNFMNGIVAEGYQPILYREFYRAAWNGWQWQYVIDVYVTAQQIQIAPKCLTDGCKFHTSEA